MKSSSFACAIALPLVLGACVTNPSEPATKPVASSSSAPAAAPTTTSASAKNTPQKVKSRDGKFEGEISGTPAPGAKFSKLLIGMSMSETQEVMGGTPDRFHSYESGKRWIPLYFGSDARRLQVLYKGQGCLTFTGGNVWGGGGGTLISIEHDSKGACYDA